MTTAKKKTETTTTEPASEIDRAHAANATATDNATKLRAQLVTADAAEADAKRQAIETDAVDDWKAHEATKTRAAQVRLRSEAADAEQARAQAEYDRLTRAHLLGELEVARVASNDRTLRARLEPVIAERIEINARLRELERVLISACVDQHSACDEAHRIGARLGMTEREVTDLLRRDRGPIGASSAAADLSEKRPPFYVNQWVLLLAELEGPNPPSLDAQDSRAARTGAAPETTERAAE